MCEYLQDNLEEDCVQAVMVRPDSRCDAYECHLERYIATTGYAPRAEESLYGLDEDYSPVSHVSLKHELGISSYF